MSLADLLIVAAFYAVIRKLLDVGEALFWAVLPEKKSKKIGFIDSAE